MIRELLRKRRIRLLFKWCWYKYIRRMDIAGFYDGVPIILSKYLVPEPQPKVHIAFNEYANLEEMVGSSEYQRFTQLIRRGVKDGSITVYPPLPPEEKVSPNCQN